MQVSKFRFALTAVIMLGTPAAVPGQRIVEPIPTVDLGVINDLQAVQDANDRDSSEFETAIRCFLDVEFDEIKRCCTLSKGQLANLEIAAGAAVEAALDGCFDGLGNRAQIVASLASYPADKNKTMLTNVVESRLRRRLLDDPDVHDQLSWAVASKRTQAVNHEIWRDAVSGILTKDQRIELANARQRRLAVRRRALLLQFVSLLDDELFFTEEQRRLVLEDLSSSESGEITMEGPLSVELPKHVADAILGRLTKTQWAKWQELTKPNPVDFALEINVK